MSEYTPITGELRGAMRQWGWVESDGSITFATTPLPPSIDVEQSLAISGSDFDRCCDAIDAVHAQLERENAALKAELDRVLGEQEEHAHTRGESITGELREVAAKTECANGRCEKLYRGDLERIADRIDAEHERQLVVLYRDMSEAEWVRVPVDADRVPIFIGDVMESDYITRTEVAAVGIKCFFSWSNIDRRWHQYEANQFCHHQPDTWERIIEDALDGYHDTDFDKLVARCKALCERTKEDE